MHINTMKLVGLDFETYGAVSLPDHGLERYASDPSFLPLIASVTQLNNYGGKDTTRYTLWDGTGREALAAHLTGRIVCAHNAGFEKRVNQWLGIDSLVEDYIDSAVLARAMGAAGKLEAAAPQLLNSDKLEDGWRLIKLFSIPSKEQLEEGDRAFDPNLIVKHAQDWETFGVYCDLDSVLSLDLVLRAIRERFYSEQEQEYHQVTMSMNEIGWPVDVATVEEMQRRYLENQEVELEKFRQECDAAELNLNSLPQLKAWCLDRGIKATSFDEDHVAKLLVRIEKKMETLQLDDPKLKDYGQVARMLRTKQILGGSSLKKLKVILNTTSEDGRLRDQYLHIGAGQTWRTTGRSVQMQNLKRLGGEGDDMLELEDMDTEWDNDKLARNLRQVFTSAHPKGRLIVGDFSSVESRGLAWWANAHWKLDAYRQGKDMYKVLAADQFGVGYDRVTKDQRTFGKVGELSCGYQAAGGAVQSFAAGMGVTLTEAEAATVVSDWRRINPEVVSLWALLDDTLRGGLHHQSYSAQVGWHWTVEVCWAVTPDSLLAIDKHAQSLLVVVRDDRGKEFMRRIFHGVYERGRSLCYYKPTERKSGPVWVNHFKDPKTKQVRFYNIYGGKLAGILTQSLCRQMFFASLLPTYRWAKMTDNVDLIGQFHDEIVLDWRPGTTGSSVTLDGAKQALNHFMSQTTLRGFPLAAEIKDDYRYTK
jgi:hypothetical protein